MEYGNHPPNVGLVAGEVDFTTVPTAGLTMGLRGVPLRILYTTYYRALFWLYAKPDIRSVKDLKGRRLGVSGSERGWHPPGSVV